MNEIIKNNIPKIKELVSKINNNIEYYVDIDIYNALEEIDNETISIVMTTFNRVKQTLFTLDTINDSGTKNIQVIIVDDSTNGYLPEDKLKKYGFEITYAKIKNKDWLNPCVNYNIGLRLIKGNILIIQNAEVCHVGNIVKYVVENIKKGEYFVFDVLSSGNYLQNDELYLLHKNGLNIEEINNFAKKHNCNWYQHYMHRRRNYHFLTAMCLQDFKMMNGGFDYDYSMGKWYDDLEFIARITHLLKLKIVNIRVEKKHLMGIHQHHDRESLRQNGEELHPDIKLNNVIDVNKRDYLMKHGKWINLYGSEDLEKDLETLLKPNHNK